MNIVTFKVDTWECPKGYLRKVTRKTIKFEWPQFSPSVFTYRKILTQCSWYWPPSQTWGQNVPEIGKALTNERWKKMGIGTSTLQNATVPLIFNVQHTVYCFYDWLCHDNNMFSGCIGGECTVPRYVPLKNESRPAWVNDLTLTRKTSTRNLHLQEYETWWPNISEFD